MPDLITTIRADALAQRKLSIKKEPGGEHAALLGTLSAEAALIGKNDGGREPTDDEVIGVIRKFVKSIDSNIAVARTDEERNRFIVDKRALETYLPQMLEGGHLGDAIKQAANDLGLAVEMRNTKLIVNALTEKYPGQIDAGSVARYIKSAA